jgi:VWFA-related protein
MGVVFLSFFQGCNTLGSKTRPGPPAYVLSSPGPFFAAGPPLSLGIIVDSSGSMFSGKLGSWGTSKMEIIQTTLPSFLATVQPDDEVFLLSVSTKPKIVQDFTNSPVLLAKAVQNLRPLGGTALYDAVLNGLALLQQGHNQKQGLVVISDGNDNASTASKDQVLMTAEARKAPIYTIAYGDASVKGAVGSVLTALAPEKLDASFLQTLSQRTNGVSFLLDTSRTSDVTGAFTQDFESIAKALRK